MLVLFQLPPSKREMLDGQPGIIRENKWVGG